MDHMSVTCAEKHAPSTTEQQHRRPAAQMSGLLCGVGLLKWLEVASFIERNIEAGSIKGKDLSA